MSDGTRQGRIVRSELPDICFLTSKGGSPTGRCLSPLTFCALLPLLLGAGCQNRALEEARQEAREAKATSNKLNYQLQTIKQDFANRGTELLAVQQSRDELQKQVDQLLQERDRISQSAQQVQDSITQLTLQKNSQANAATALEKQVAELKARVEEQQKLIEELRKVAAAEPVETPPTTDPNKGL